jgi:hypothetical protein
MPSIRFLEFVIRMGREVSSEASEEVLFSKSAAEDSIPGRVVCPSGVLMATPTVSKVKDSKRMQTVPALRMAADRLVFFARLAA